MEQAHLFKDDTATTHKEERFNLYDHKFMDAIVLYLLTSEQHYISERYKWKKKEFQTNEKSEGKEIPF